MEVPWDTSGDLHAGAGETSLMLAAHPDLVHMERVPSSAEGTALGRLQTLRDAGVHTGIWWYADHPTHYAGDARAATAETGERLLTSMAEALAQAVRAIEADSATRQLQDEFYAAARAPGNSPPGTGA